jgi:hypothetical protein
MSPEIILRQTWYFIFLNFLAAKPPISTWRDFFYFVCWVLSDNANAQLRRLTSIVDFSRLIIRSIRQSAQTTCESDELLQLKIKCFRKRVEYVFVSKWKKVVAKSWIHFMFGGNWRLLPDSSLGSTKSHLPQTLKDSHQAPMGGRRLGTNEIKRTLWQKFGSTSFPQMTFHQNDFSQKLQSYFSPNNLSPKRHSIT